MEHILVQMMAALTPLSEDEKAAIVESFPIKTFEKGTYLMKQGEPAREAFFVIEGCIREFELVEGEEKTTAFYTEHESAANFGSLATGAPSKRNFICEENTLVAVLNPAEEQKLYDRFPRFESFCRAGMEEMMGTEKDEMMEYLALNPEQRYLKLMNGKPDLFNRVPQYQIASYLGVKPETLSRIRKRIQQQNALKS